MFQDNVHRRNQISRARQGISILRESGGRYAGWRRKGEEVWK